MDLTMSFKPLIESTLDVAVVRPPSISICGIYPNRNSRKEITKRKFAPAKVRLLETSGRVQGDPTGRHGPNFLIQVSWVAQTKKTIVVPLTASSTLTRVPKPKHCILIRTEQKDLGIRLVAQSETECQRWTVALLEALSLSRCNRQSQRFSLCLSNYLFSIMDSRQARTWGLDEFEYWAVLDKNIGLVLFPAARSMMMVGKTGPGSAKAVSLPFEQIVQVGIAQVENAVDIGKVLEIGLNRTSKDEKRGNSLKRLTIDKRVNPAAMTRRWRHKSGKKAQEDEQDKSVKPLTPTASLGFHTLSFFCPDAQKFVEEWRKATAQKSDKAVSDDINDNRLSSTSNSSNLSSSTSHSNLSVLNSLLRRSLPSLNSNITTPSPRSPGPAGASPTGSSKGRHPPQPPPLPSRKELEQRENDRLFEQRLRRHWHQVKEEEKLNKTFDSSLCDGDSLSPTSPTSRRTPGSHYKLLPADTIPVLKLQTQLDTPPPLPPKNDTGRRGSDTSDNLISNGQVSQNRKDIPCHYKRLTEPFGEVPSPLSPVSTSEMAPPLPPRRAHQNSEPGIQCGPSEEGLAAKNGYKTLSAWGAPEPQVPLASEVSMKLDGYHCHQKQNKFLALYNRLPDPVPCTESAACRYSLETEV